MDKKCRIECKITEQINDKDVFSVRFEKETDKCPTMNETFIAFTKLMNELEKEGK